MSNGRGRAIVAADGLALLCLLGAFWLVVHGAYRTILDGNPFTVRWWDFLFAGAAIAGVRHAISPRPSILATIGGWKTWLAARPAVGNALLVGGLTRLVVLLIGITAVNAVGFPPNSGQVGSGRQAAEGIGARFDANWYTDIAVGGYSFEGDFGRQQNVAFFPAYPILLRAAGTLTGAFDPSISTERRLFRLTTSGIVISLAAFLWASWYFGRLAEELLAEDQSRNAVWLLAAYPFAVFFSTAYTESFFLLTALGAWYSLRHRQWVAGTIWGLLAGLTRPNGFFLSIPLGLIALGLPDARGARAGSDASSRPAAFWRLPDLRAVVVASMPTVGMLAFTAYLYTRTNQWFAWAKIQVAWGRTFSSEVPLSGVTRSVNSLLDLIIMRPYDALNLLGLAFAFAMLWPVWRRLGAVWTAYVAVNVMPPLFAGGLLSMGRLTATMFPLFLALAGTLPARATPGVVAAFAMLQGLVAVLFFTWRSLY